MITAATGIGIPGNWANAIATYLVRSYDVYDPAQVWEGLSEVMEVPISHRKRFFKTWMSYISTEVPQSLEERIRSIAPSYEDQRVPTASAKAKPQKFYAMDGEVLRCPADAEDELGVSWLTAVQMAKQQVEKARSLQPVAPATPARQDESVQVEMVRQMGESSRQTLELLAGVGGEDPEKKVLAQQLEAERLSNLRTELQAQMDRQNQETRHQMDLMSGQLTTSLTELTRAVTAIAQGASKPPATIIDSLKELAGLKEQLGVLFPQPAPPQQAFNFPMGPNGEMVPMSLDNMFRFAEFQDKRETVGAVRKSLPTLIKLGDDLVKAFRAETAAVAAAAPGAAAGAESAAIPLGPRTDNVALPAPEPDEPLRTSRCPACNEANHYPRGDWALICGNCHAPLYTRGGSELMLVPSETLEPELVSAEVPEGGPEMADPVTATPVEVEPTSVVLGSVMEVPAEATIA
ncbi:MAG: hypothetical protein U1B30_15985 [Pseudomonadota bacterium]|nr:hypothetical protein [Pseudomonadota bacterium]